MNKNYDQNNPFQFLYKNYRGEISKRKVIPVKEYKGSTEYHPEHQLLMEAIDLDKNEIRIFAVKDIIEQKITVR